MNKHTVSNKPRRGVKVVFIIVGVFILAELIALAWLATSVSRYKDFWASRARGTGEVTYLALGDSAAQGIGASSPMQGYVGLIAKDVEKKTGKSVRIVNISKSGAQMDDYLRDQAPVIKSLKPDIVTIEIGGNDVAKFDAATYRSKFKKVLASLPDGSFVSNMPLFNSRPGSTENAKLASKIIEEELQSYPKLVFVDLQKETTDNQSIFGFAPDLFHPNNLSYKNWANAFLKQIDKTLPDADSITSAN